MREFALLGISTTVLAVGSVLTPNGNVARDPAPTQLPATAVASIASPPPLMPAVESATAEDAAPVADAAPDAAQQVDTAPQTYVYECIEGATTTLTDSPCPPGAESRLIALHEPNSYVPSSPDTGYAQAQYPSDGYEANESYPSADGVYGFYGRRHNVAPRRQPQANNHPVHPSPSHRPAPRNRGR